MKKIAILGQGYVGLPLALEFSKYFPVIGFDIDRNRVEQLNIGVDKTCEADTQQIKDALTLATTSDFSLGYKASCEVTDLSDSNVYIVTVPTPIDEFKAPNLNPLALATQTIAQVLKEDDIVIFESTVYPGCTEEFCVPILEKFSNLKFNKDFFVGYSPERIVPGDKINTLTSIKKVTSGSTPEIAEVIDTLYQSIIVAGTHKAPSIKVAEASKAIENAQRDVNISFMNELALIFDKVGIDTNDVLEAAGTKFNFLKYKPGLVGGHCISVDPYYLTHKAVELGYHPNVILSGRRVNDSIPGFIASKLVKLMINKNLTIKGANILILGFTFKENCPDIRNTKVFPLFKELEEFGCVVDVYDPLVNMDDVKKDFGINLKEQLEFQNQYDAIVLAVAHSQFLSMDINLLKNKVSVVFDIKAVLDREMVDARL